MRHTVPDYDHIFFKCLTSLFYLFVFFPYLAIMPLGSDTQPNAFVVALFILAFGSRNLRLPGPCWALGLVALMAAGLFLLDPLSFNAARSLFGYLSLFVVSAATYLCVRSGYPISKGFFYFIVLSWLFLGLLQLLIDPSIGNELLSRAKSSDTRGVVSFAAEPGYYGSMMFLILMVLTAQKKEGSILALLCIGQIVLVAQSSVVIAVLSAPMLIYFLLRGRALLTNRYFISLVIVLFLLTPQIITYLEESRITALFSLVIDDPALLIMADGSGNQRAASMFLSLKGTLDNFLLPNGLNAYHDYIVSVSYEYRNIFWAIDRADRIMSGYGAAFFELGIFGLAIPVIITIAIFRHFSRADWPHAVILNVGTHAILFSSLPLALPAVGFLIGYLLATPAERKTATPSARLSATPIQ